MISHSYKVVYESRGRNSYKKVNAAIYDLCQIKLAHNANYKYGIVSAIPRDGSRIQLTSLIHQEIYIRQQNMNIIFQ